MVFLVGVGGFGLGRLSALEQDTSRITILYSSDENAPVEVVASKYGTRYFFPWCGGSSNIKKGNIIRFDTQEKAENEGYTLAKNCKGI